MAFGVPDQPPNEKSEFTDSHDDETCPACGWSVRDALLDHNAAFNSGWLMAVEIAESPMFQSMAGAQLVALYWRCPKCETLFTTEEELSLGAMS